MKMPRGRWKRVEISRVPSSYLEWVCTASICWEEALLREAVAVLHARFERVLAARGLGRLLAGLPPEYRAGGDPDGLSAGANGTRRFPAQGGR
jgi:hypothetical protein